MTEYLEIDGSVLEGGGQIVRISISLSAILGVPVRIINIRAGRRKPGLAAQHMKGIQLVAEMCQAKLKGASIGSTEIEFAPGKIKGGNYTADTGTAGSISLLIQVALPVALFAPSAISLELRGGTNADMAPQIDYTVQVFRPLLRLFGADFTCDIKRRGYFPKGGGVVSLEVCPVRRLRGVELLRGAGAMGPPKGISFVSSMLSIKNAYEMAEAARTELESDIRVYKETKDTTSDYCSAIVLWVELSSGSVLGASGLGRRGAAPWGAGAGAAVSLREALDAGVSLDNYAQDQVILYMLLAEGKSSVTVGEVTLHTKTAMYIAELIAKIKFDVRPEDNLNVIECTGLGHENKYNLS